MPSFQYSALDANGQKLSGRIDAAGRAEAIISLAEQDIYVTEIDSRGKRALPLRSQRG